MDDGLYGEVEEEEEKMKMKLLCLPGHILCDYYGDCFRFKAQNHETREREREKKSKSEFSA